MSSLFNYTLFFQSYYTIFWLPPDSYSFFEEGQDIEIIAADALGKATTAYMYVDTKRPYVKEVEITDSGGAVKYLARWEGKDLSGDGEIDTLSLKRGNNEYLSPGAEYKIRIGYSEAMKSAYLYGNNTLTGGSTWYEGVVSVDGGITGDTLIRLRISGFDLADNRKLTEAA